MFRKAHDVGVSSSTLLRNKEARAAREAAAKGFPGADEAALDALLPAKGVESVKFSCKLVGLGSAGDHVPTVVDLDPRAPLKKLMPTVYGLWRAPALLPTLLIPQEVSTFILGGADLMLPGVYVPRAGGLPPFAAGQLVAVRVAGNPLPCAVGEALVGSDQAVSGGMKGRGVRILHSYRDELWAYGGRGIPNAGFGPGAVRPLGPEPCLLAGEDEDGDNDDDDGEEEVEEEGREHEDEEGGDAHGNEATDQEGIAERSYPWVGWDADTLLSATLLQALRKHVGPGDLPMLANVLYGTHMVGCRPAGTSLDVKRSSWKKVSTFLAHWASPAAEGGPLLTVEENKTKGTFTVTGFAKHHDALRAHRPWPPALEAGNTAAAAAGDAEAGPAAAHASAGMPTSTARAGSSAPPPLLPTLPGGAPSFSGGLHATSSASGRGGGSSSGGGDRESRQALLSSGPAVSAVMAPGAPSQPYVPPVVTDFVRPSNGAQQRIFKWMAAEAVRAGKLPCGVLPPRPRQLGRRSESAESPGPFGAAGQRQGGGGFDPRAALALLSAASQLLYTRSDAGAVLSGYIAARGLPLPQDKRRVALDLWLADALTGGSGKAPGEASSSSSKLHGGQGAQAKGKGGSGSGACQHPSFTASDFPALGGGSRGSSSAALKGVSSGKPSGGHGSRQHDNDDDDSEGSDGGSVDEDGDGGSEGEGAPTPSAAELGLAALLAACPQPPAHEERSGATLAREDVTSTWGERLHVLHTLTFPTTGDVLLRSGPPPPVTIFVRKLQGGRKHTTHVQGYEAYRLPPDQLVKECAKLFAAAATTQPAANNPTLVEIFVQGDVAEALAAHLVSRYGLPRRLVAVTTS